METRATADTVRALGISRSEERYINARLVIKHEVEHIMASNLVAWIRLSSSWLMNRGRPT